MNNFLQIRFCTRLRWSKENGHHCLLCPVVCCFCSVTRSILTPYRITFSLSLWRAMVIPFDSLALNENKLRWQLLVALGSSFLLSYTLTLWAVKSSSCVVSFDATYHGRCVRPDKLSFVSCWLSVLGHLIPARYVCASGSNSSSSVLHQSGSQCHLTGSCVRTCWVHIFAVFTRIFYNWFYGKNTKVFLVVNGVPRELMHLRIPQMYAATWNVNSSSSVRGTSINWWSK